MNNQTVIRAENISNRYYSLSSQIELYKTEYYNQLESQQRSISNITKWLLWFLGCIEESISNADEILLNVLLKDKIWDVININLVNTSLIRIAVDIVII